MHTYFSRGLVFVFTLVCLAERPSSAQCGYSWRDGPQMDGGVSAFLQFRGELISGGSFTIVDGIAARNIVAWDGLRCRPIGLGTDGGITSLVEYRGDLIAGGRFSLAGGASAIAIARWDGSQWHPLGSGMISTSGLATVATLTVYQGDLIAAGRFSSAGGVTAKDIARWDGTSWHSMGSGVNQNGEIANLCVYGDKLIACGRFTSLDGVSAQNVASWNGSNWEPLGGGLGGNDAVVMTVFDGKLIVGGSVRVGTARCLVASWDGSTWQVLGFQNYDDLATSFTTFENSLVVGGEGPGVQRFVNGAWEHLEYYEAKALAEYHGELVVELFRRWGPAGPVMVQQPGSRGIVAGGSATFRALAIGSDTLAYQWRHDGAALEDGAGVSGSATPELKLTGVTAANAGEYDCVIQNGCDDVTSAPARLRVLQAVAPPKGPPVMVGPAISE